MDIQARIEKALKAQQQAKQESEARSRAAREAGKRWGAVWQAVTNEMERLAPLSDPLQSLPADATPWLALAALLKQEHPDCLTFLPEIIAEAEAGEFSRLAILDIIKACHEHPDDRQQVEEKIRHYTSTLTDCIWTLRIDDAKYSLEPGQIAKRRQIVAVAAPAVEPIREVQRRTKSGDVGAKLFGILNHHHDYDDGGISKTAEAMPLEEMISQSRLPKSTVSNKLKSWFASNGEGGHEAYKRLVDNGRLGIEMKRIAGEFQDWNSSPAD